MPDNNEINPPGSEEILEIEKRQRIKRLLGERFELGGHYRGREGEPYPRWKLLDATESGFVVLQGLNQSKLAQKLNARLEIPIGDFQERNAESSVSEVPVSAGETREEMKGPDTPEVEIQNQDIEALKNEKIQASLGSGFKFGQNVKAKRSDGTIEDDWKLVGSSGEIILIAKDDESGGLLTKGLTKEEFLGLNSPEQKGKAVEAFGDKEDDYILEPDKVNFRIQKELGKDFKRLQKVKIKNPDTGEVENDWEIVNVGLSGVRVRKSVEGGYRDFDVAKEEFLKWNGGEASKDADEAKKKMEELGWGADMIKRFGVGAPVWIDPSFRESKGIPDIQGVVKEVVDGRNVVVDFPGYPQHSGNCSINALESKISRESRLSSDIDAQAEQVDADIAGQILKDDPTAVNIEGKTPEEVEQIEQNWAVKMWTAGVSALKDKGSRLYGFVSRKVAETSGGGMAKFKNFEIDPYYGMTEEQRVSLTDEQSKLLTDRVIKYGSAGRWQGGTTPDGEVIPPFEQEIGVTTGAGNPEVANFISQANVELANIQETSSPKEKISILRGLAAGGFYIKEKKDKAMAWALEKAVTNKTEEAGGVNRFLQSFADIRKERAKKAADQRESLYKPGGWLKQSLKTSGGIGTLMSNAVQIYRVFHDLGFQGFNPLRNVTAAAMLIGESAEALKEAELKRLKLGTRIEDMELAADAAWDLYHKAKSESKDGNISSKDLSKIYIRNLPEDILQKIKTAVNDEPTSLFEDLIQAIGAVHVRDTVGAIEKKLKSINDRADIEEKEKENLRDGVRLQYEKSLREFEVMIGEKGKLSLLAYGSKAIESLSNKVRMVMMIETLAEHAIRGTQALTHFIENKWAEKDEALQYSQKVVDKLGGLAKAHEAAFGPAEAEPIHEKIFENFEVVGVGAGLNLEDVFAQALEKEGYVLHADLDQAKIVAMTIVGRLTNLSPESIKELGISSGDPYNISAGDKIDVNKLIEAAWSQGGGSPKEKLAEILATYGGGVDDPSKYMSPQNFKDYSSVDSGETIQIGEDKVEKITNNETQEDSKLKKTPDARTQAEELKKAVVASTIATAKVETVEPAVTPGATSPKVVEERELTRKEAEEFTKNLYKGGKLKTGLPVEEVAASKPAMATASPGETMVDVSTKDPNLYAEKVLVPEKENVFADEPFAPKVETVPATPTATETPVFEKSVPPPAPTFTDAQMARLMQDVEEEVKSDIKEIYHINWIDRWGVKDWQEARVISAKQFLQTFSDYKTEGPRNVYLEGSKDKHAKLFKHFEGLMNKTGVAPNDNETVEDFLKRLTLEEKKMMNVPLSKAIQQTSVEDLPIATRDTGEIKTAGVQAEEPVKSVVERPAPVVETEPAQELDAAEFDRNAAAARGMDISKVAPEESPLSEQLETAPLKETPINVPEKDGPYDMSTSEEQQLLEQVRREIASIALPKEPTAEEFAYDLNQKIVNSESVEEAVGLGLEKELDALSAGAVKTQLDEIYGQKSTLGLFGGVSGENSRYWKNVKDVNIKRFEDFYNRYGKDGAGLTPFKNKENEKQYKLFQLIQKLRVESGTEPLLTETVSGYVRRSMKEALAKAHHLKR